MSIKDVKAIVNGDIRDMTLNQDTGQYEVAFNAPENDDEEIATYSVSIIANDNEGNTTIVNTGDPEIGDSLQLKVRRSDLGDDILTNELGQNMLDMIAPIYNNSEVVLYLFQAFGIVLQKEVDFIAKDFISQIFPQTATWGMKYWEDEYGIIPDPSWSLQQRRKNFMSNLEYKAPITPRKIENRITAITGIETSIHENTDCNTFEVLIHGYTEDYSNVLELLDRIVPAHLHYVINTRDVVNSKLMDYYRIYVSECESVNVKFAN